MKYASFIEPIEFLSRCEDVVALGTLRNLELPEASSGGCREYGEETQLRRCGAYSRFNVCSYTGDATAHIDACRRELCSALGIDTHHLIMPRQTHSATVSIIDKDFLTLEGGECDERLQGVDALVTSLTGVAIGVNTADCVPVVMRDVSAGVIAVAHAGWKGTVARIAARTVEAMQQLGASPLHIEAAIGPSICPDCFEVGDEVVEQFAAARFPIDAIMQRNETTGKAHIDLWEANVIVLEEVGVRREAVALSHRCTRCNPMRYFSARRIGIASGRNFTAILRLR